MDYEAKREQLVNTLKKIGRIKTKTVEKAFLETPRELFIPDEIKHYAYIDAPLEIGENQTISAPHMIAIMCEAVSIKKGQKILEIGAGSGYHAAIISKIVESKGHVYTVERIKNLAENAKQNLKNANITNVTVENGDGSLGLSKHAPYDHIYVTCAAPDIPDILIGQMKDPGTLLIPIGQRICELVLLEKKDKKITTKELGGCAFVPLIGKYGH